jgi:CheY-like chemotaxis protein
MSAERRVHERHSLLLRVEWEDGATDWTENVSAGGLFIRSSRVIERGKNVGLQLSFPGLLPPLRVTGTAAWAREASSWASPGIGIQAEVGKETLDRIARAGAAETEVRHATYRILMVHHATPSTPPLAPINVCAVRGADDAIAALDEPPELVLTDLFAPSAECLRMLKELRSRSRAPIIAIAGVSSDDVSRATAAGVAAVLPRGTRAEQVFDTVTALLRLS